MTEAGAFRGAGPPSPRSLLAAGSVTRAVQVSGRWFDDLCLWLERPLGSPGCIGWPVLLAPEVVDRRFRLPETATSIYTRVLWRQPVPESLELSAEIEWISSDGRGVEIGIRTRATSHGDSMAQGVFVSRLPSEGQPFGLPDVPPHPQPPDLVRRRTLVLDENFVRECAAFTGTGVHLDNVQSLILFITQMRFAGIPLGGQAESWFREPVPAGSLLECCQSTSDTGIWALRLVGRPEPATIARVQPFPPNAECSSIFSK